MLVGIAGPPGAGKSTFAEKLVAALQTRCGSGSAALVPMDGFHLDNAELQGLGLLSVKGAPETFDAAGFARLVQGIRLAKDDIRYPIFDREQDKTLKDAATLGSNVRFVIFEGNYLLLQQGDWSALDGVFDLTAMLSVPLVVLRERLVSRWLAHGLSQSQAEARADGNDMVNARNVLANSTAADVILTLHHDGQLAVLAEVGDAGRTG